VPKKNIWGIVKRPEDTLDKTDSFARPRMSRLLLKGAVSEAD